MNKEVEKIRAEVKRRREIHRKAKRIESAFEDNAILCYIDSLQEEPVYTDFTKALAECIHQAQGSVFDPMVHAELWENELVKLAKSKEPVREDLDLGCGVIWKGEEPVSEDLEKASKEWIRPQLDKSYADYGETKMMELTHFDGYAMLDAIEFGVKWQKAKDHSCSKDLCEYINELSKKFPEVSFAKLSRIAVRVAKWQKENLWKPADGDDLPEIDREVVAFQEIFPTDVDVPSLLKIVIAHRPNTEGYDGKSITTGQVEHYTPKTYDKGGWNIPDIVCWLDVELPKEIEP